MDKEKPIIWMIDSLGPGGAEQLMPTNLYHLKDTGFNLRVCVLQVRQGNPIASELERIGIPVDLVLVPNLRHPLNLSRILRYLRSQHPQLIHTQLEFSDILGTIAAKILSIPSVSTLHTLDTFTDKKSASWRLRLRWFVLRNLADRIIAVSEKTRIHHLQSGEFNPDKVVTLYNGIDIACFKNADEAQHSTTRQALNLPLNSPIILTVAVLREPKGIQYMINALPTILEQIPNAHYLIVGDGPYGASLQNLVTALAIQDHVTFAGHRTDVPDLLACSDIFVLPTLGDALPTVLIEALAAEKPIVASNVGGVPEIIENNVSGLLVSPADSLGLANACLKLLKNNEQAQQIALAGRKMVQQRFHINVQVEQLSKIYEKVSASYGKP